MTSSFRQKNSGTLKEVKTVMAHGISSICAGQSQESILGIPSSRPLNLILRLGGYYG